MATMAQTLDLPPLEEVLANARMQWTAANLIGPTATTWEVEEQRIRNLHAHLSAMSQEERDAEIIRIHAKRLAEHKATLDHVNGMLGQVSRKKNTAIFAKKKRKNTKRRKNGKG